jgi:Uma2 family endonuclease
MQSLLLEGFESLNLSLNDPEERLLLSGVSWQEYEKLLAHLGDSSRYRVSYLEGILEIMSPSRRHEVSKKDIGRLLEVYLEEAEIDFWGLGSTTFRRRQDEAGKEPDECYCIGTEKDFPDLAIEVILTSGGINVLELYRRLGVKEVWFWQHNCLQVYHLSDRGQYQEQATSQLLPNLDLALLAKYVNAPNPRLAVREFRAQLRQSLEDK